MKNNGLSLTGVLFIVFLVLKLTGNLDWSWIWIFSPFWIPLLIIFSISLVIFIAIVIAVSLGYPSEEIKSRIDFLKEKFKKD